ncbi:MAG: SDR family oxidoreductase [Gloeocapsa sp. DLM2.Bin57]|nr:MAG: SDR family oxidoreductase [Gloeocapsa sp. DLM2.Bin57]
MNNALITGASQGIGEAFAQELASRKTNLVLVARSADKLQELAKQLQDQKQIKVEVIPLDLTAPGACQQLYQRVSDLGIEIDLLINNAGFGDYGAFADRKLAKQLEMIQLNITALVELTYLFLGEMQQRQRGAILNISSIAGFQPLPYLSTYAATKAFVLSFSESLWAENRTSGVKIMAVCPGPTESNFSQVAEFPKSNSNSPSKAASAIQVVKEALQALEKDQPTVVTGGLANQVIVNLPRFFPRETLVNLVEKQFRSN